MLDQNAASVQGKVYYRTDTLCVYSKKISGFNKHTVLNLIKLCNENLLKCMLALNKKFPYGLPYLY